MTDIEGLQQAAQTALAAKHAAREAALPQSRATIRLCANAVRATHRGEFAVAAELLADAQRRLDEIRAALREHLDVYYAGFVADAQKEFAEAAITAAAIQGHAWPTPAELRVDWAPYLNGMGEAIGELRRHTLNELRRGDAVGCEAILSAMDEMFALIVALDFPDAITSNLRRTADLARSIIEKTRGDLTTAAIQARLSTQVAALSTQLTRLASSEIADTLS